MSNISVFANVGIVTDPMNYGIVEYLEKTRNGEWEDIVSNCRLIEDKEKRNALKRLMPTATLSGLFDYRSDGGIRKHSGIIAIDLDEVERLQELKAILEKDPYTYSVFMSTSGNGLRWLLKIVPTKHRESFEGICKYLYDNYGEVCDLNGINVSKPYVVSFDPFLYLNHNSVIFKEYTKQATVVKRIQDFVYVPSDLKSIIEQIISKRVNICEDYNDWLKVGFALSEALGEDGRQYFHDISSTSKKYKYETCNKQYTCCIKAKGTTKVSISTLYYFAKINGISIVSEQTRKIVRITKNGKRAGLNKEQILENLEKYESIKNADSVVERVLKSPIHDDDEDEIIPQLEMFISNNYQLRMNEVTGFLEQNDTVLTPSNLNSIFISARKIIPKLDYQLMMRLLKSEFIESYNPFFEFLGSNGTPYILPETPDPKNNSKYESPLIDKLASTIENEMPAYTIFFLRKWYVSIISAMHRVHSPLLLALLGPQNTGKTEFFRRLLPHRLQMYYAESKLDREKDDELLMTESILVMDDELGGKSKQEAKKLNNITSKQWFSVRRPYGDHNEKILRIAVLCGTSNYMEILSDPTGNRRIIPIVVSDINKTLYNSINKTELLKEAYKLYREGFDWRITGVDIPYLNSNKTEHQMIIKEKELLEAYYEIPKDGEPNERMSTTAIAAELEKMTGIRVSINIIGQQMKDMGFTKKGTRLGSGTRTAHLWLVKKINRGGSFPTYVPDEEDKKYF